MTRTNIYDKHEDVQKKLLDSQKHQSMKKTQYEKCHEKWSNIVNQQAQAEGLSHDEANAVSVIYIYKCAYAL